MGPTIPTTQKPMNGDKVVQLNGVEIPEFMLGDITYNLEEGSRTSNRLSGTNSRPSGKYDDPTVTIVFYPQEWEDLAHFFPNLYGTPSGEQLLGNITLGKPGVCNVSDPFPVNIHDVCMPTDDKDMYIPAALARMTFDSVINTEDDLSVTITLHPQPNSEGLVVLGTRDLTEPSVYNAGENETEPIGS